MKEGKYGYCKGNQVTWLHYLGPKHSFAHEIVRENLSIHMLLTITTFPTSIQSNFILILPLKKMEVSIPVVNGIWQYKQNYS